MKCVQTEGRSHTRFLMPLIHARGLREFVRFPDLQKPLPTDSHIVSFLVRLSYDVITSFQSHQNAQSFFLILICFKKRVAERREEKFLRNVEFV